MTAVHMSNNRVDCNKNCSSLLLFVIMYNSIDSRREKEEEEEVVVVVVVVIPITVVCFQAFGITCPESVEDLS